MLKTLLVECAKQFQRLSSFWQNKVSHSISPLLTRRTTYGQLTTTQWGGWQQHQLMLPVTKPAQ